MPLRPPGISRPIEPPLTDAEIADAAIITAKLLNGAVTKAKTVSSALQRAATFVVAADDSGAAGKAVADYVVPAGSTSAQTVINNAINALPAIGGKVTVIEGTYIVDGRILLPSNVHLELLKGATIKLKDSFNADLFGIITNADQTNGNTNIIVDGEGIIDGNKANQAAGSIYGVQFVKLTSSRISGITIANCSYRGFGMYTSDYNEISQVISQNNGGYGIFLYDNSKYNHVVANITKGNTWSGIVLESSCSYNTVHGNISYYNASAAGSQGIYLLNSSNYNVVSDNVVDYTLAGSGIYIYNSSYNVVVGNSCTRNNRYGLLLESVSQTVVTGNTCYQNGYSGIRTSSFTENAIVGNVLRSNNDKGLEISGTKNVVAGNLVLNSYYHGITLTTSTLNTVANNIVQGSGYAGINLETSSNNSINGNICLENGKYWNNFYDQIKLYTNSDYNNIQGNTCRQGALANKPRYGIYIETADCDGNIVENNDLYSAGASGPLSDLGTNTRIRNNCGYSTDSLKKSALSVAIGLSGVYGAATAIQGPSRLIRSAKLRINIGGTFGAETVTVKVECAWDDGTTTYVEKSYTAVGSEWLSDADWFTLWKDTTGCNKINVYAKTTAGSTSVTCSVDVAAAT